MDNQFTTVEDEYFRLKGQFATGRLTREQFETALRALMFTDAQGRYWMIGADSGKWFVHDGTNWIEQNPTAAPSAPAAPFRPSNVPERTATTPYTLPAAQPAAQNVYRAPAPAPQYAAPAALPPAPPAPAQKSGGCGRTLLFGCLGLIVICGLLGVGGFLAYQSGALTTDTLLAAAGLGPGHVTVNNFRDDAIHVKITELDVTDERFTVIGDLDLNAFDVRAFNTNNAARHSVVFTLVGGTTLGECVMRVASGDQYQFIALPDGIMVNRENKPPTLGTDLVVATSALCRAQ